MIIDTGMVAILITIFLAIIAAAVGYGVLLNKVASNRYDIQELKKRYDAIDEKLDNLCSLVQQLIATHEK